MGKAIIFIVETFLLYAEGAGKVKHLDASSQKLGRQIHAHLVGGTQTHQISALHGLGQPFRIERLDRQIHYAQATGMERRKRLVGILASCRDIESLQVQMGVPLNNGCKFCPGITAGSNDDNIQHDNIRIKKMIWCNGKAWRTTRSRVALWCQRQNK